MTTKADKGALFNKIIEDGRKRKKAEERANLMLGSGRAQSFSGSTNARKPTLGGSLASRVGIVKKQTPSRSAASSPVNGSRTGARPIRNLNRIVSDSRLDQRDQALDLLTADSSPSTLRNQAKIQDASSDGAGFSIRGHAVPQRVTVVAQNFATGTTAQDIESVMLSISEDAQCNLVAWNPTVIAEIVFPNRQSADEAVAKFNNKMADGHQLYVYIKPTPTEPVRANLPPSAPRAERPSQRYADDKMVDVDHDRQRYDEERRNNARRAEVGYQGGRIGYDEPRVFHDSRPTGPRSGSRLYSDQLMGSRHPRERYGR